MISMALDFWNTVIQGSMTLKMSNQIKNSKWSWNNKYKAEHGNGMWSQLFAKLNACHACYKEDRQLRWASSKPKW